MCTLIRDMWPPTTSSQTLTRTSPLPASGMMTARGRSPETWSVTWALSLILSTTTASPSTTRGTVRFIFSSHFPQHWLILMKWIDEPRISLQGNEMDIVLKLRTAFELWRHGHHAGESDVQQYQLFKLIHFSFWNNIVLYCLSHIVLLTSYHHFVDTGRLNHIKDASSLSMTIFWSFYLTILIIFLGEPSSLFRSWVWTTSRL